MSEKKKPRSPVNGQPTPNPTLITSANAREYAARSHKVRREKGRIREALLKELDKMYTTNEGEQVDGYTLMAKAAIARMMKNPKYWEIVRDTTGEKPIDKVDMDVSGDAHIKVWFPDDDD